MKQNWYTDEMPDEVSYDDIMAREEEFHHWDYEAFDNVETGFEAVEEELKGYTAEMYNALSEREQEDLVDKIVKIFRDTGVFPGQYYTDMGIMQEIEKCIAYDAKFDGDTVSCGMGVGSGMCNFLFPNINDVPTLHDVNKKNASTVFERYHNDEYLRKAIKFCFSYRNGSPTPSSVLSGIKLVGSAPSNFRPMNAKAIYERFCPEGGTIYDPCCVDRETEYFNGKKWIPICDYKEGDKVLQYEEDGTARLVNPEEYIHYKSSAPFYKVGNQQSTGDTQVVHYRTQQLTGNHQVVHYKSWEDKTLVKHTFDSLKGEIANGAIPIPVSCHMLCGDVSVSNSVLLTIYSSVLPVPHATGTTGISEFVKTENGQRFLTEELFTLSWQNRVDLLAYFQLFGDQRDVCNDYDDSRLSFLNKENLQVIETLYNLTYSDYNADIVRLNGVYALQVFESNASEFGGDVVEVQDEDKYCFVVPSHMLVLRRNKRVFITGNCGFGGRLLGALSSKKNFRYVGTDPCTETMYNLHRLADYIEMTTGRDESYELHCCGSEVFCGPENSVDFVFTSPPYFNLELYSTEETQCFNKFPVLEDWLEGYVRGTIKNIKHMLKPGKYCAINIADFKCGSETVAYVDEWIRISEEEGMPLFDTVYLGVNARAGSRQQQFGEKKKENILIFKKPL